ncbi:transcription antitermination factor NusB [Actinomarinicola tropica]|uniref:transcription antitermination factor NusB n=1 Tax=Actinomarinicola tropica TaxID=2789776 RepID=UPI0018976C48|nr:transcription antitermination factor NusB [Actinomarinicola tropica]
MSAPGVAVRRAAIDALVRIDRDDAYANLVLPSVLDGAELDERDRHLVTELVYGSTRRRRSLDWLYAPFVHRELDPEVRAALRVGTYQLHLTDVPDHAAVSATVGAVGGRVRGFVNAVLRKVAAVDVTWPDDATRLSYPDWILDRLRGDLGEEDALASLEAMNEPAVTHRREDGYVQDLASQWVVELCDAQPGERVADLCAAPGGKSTGLARSGATVVAGDLRPSRVALVAANAERTGAAGVHALVADAAAPPFPDQTFDRVLVDAPCTGLGVLRRRADARWRGGPEDVERLAELQRRIVDAAVPLVRPGGLLVYSVCTLTAAETLGVDAHLAAAWPQLEPLPAPPEPWRPWGRGGLLLPQAAGADGMMILRLRRPA